MNEAEERAAFEAHILKGLREAMPERTDFDYFTDRMERNKRYTMGWVQSQWEGWKARATHGVSVAEQQMKERKA